MKGRVAPAEIYDRRISFVAPATLADRVTAAAQSRMMSINSWLRGAILEQLAKETSVNDVQRRSA
jgi:hypothetical protein